MQNTRHLAVMLFVAASVVMIASEPSRAEPKQGTSGRYNCSCMIGIQTVAGTCSMINNGDNTATCGKRSGDTCSATCQLITFTHGLTGGGGLVIQRGSGGTVGGTGPAIGR